MASNQRHCFDCNSLSVSRRFLMNIAMFGLNFSNPKKAIESSENSWLLLSSKVSSEVFKQGNDSSLVAVYGKLKGSCSLRPGQYTGTGASSLYGLEVEDFAAANHFRLFIAKHLEHKQARSSLQGSDSPPASRYAAFLCAPACESWCHTSCKAL